MKILFIEDHFIAANLAGYLEAHGLTVFSVSDLFQADILLEEKGPFDAAIVDLVLDIRDLPLELHAEAERQYAGWIYYKHILSKIPPLDKNTVICSAFTKIFREMLSENEKEKIFFIDKGDSDYHVQVLNALRLIGGSA